MKASDGSVIGASAVLAAPDSVSALFQPVVDLHSSTIFGYEALARWPAFVSASPADVFALAKVRGMVHRIDSAARAAALREARAFSAAATTTFFLNMEMSSMITAFDIDRQLDAIGTDLDVVLEITERDIDADIPRLMDLVVGARGRHMRVALDDVGANPATLEVLALVAPDIVKLDASILRDVNRSAGTLARVRDYLDDSNAVLLAEGIESEADLECARSLGATLGQGWLLGYPAALGVRDLRPR